MLFSVHVPFLGNTNAGSPSFHLVLFLRALAPVPFAKGEDWLPLSGSLYSFRNFPETRKPGGFSAHHRVSTGSPCLLGLEWNIFHFGPAMYKPSSKKVAQMKAALGGIDFVRSLMVEL